MELARESYFQNQLMIRKERLAAALTRPQSPGHLHHLLAEVDAALARLETGNFGLCESCHEPIEANRLLANPLTRFCLDHLSVKEVAALERDLELAAGIQANLLPRRDTQLPGWGFAYHYQPASLVSGDFCDLIPAGDGQSNHFFFLGDISGKGVAASLLMSHLHAIFRSLVALGLPLAEILTRANRLFCEHTLPESFATVVCGRLTTGGALELLNAGHCPPLLFENGKILTLESQTLPIGLFCEQPFSPVQARLQPSDTLLLYTDGLAEQRNLQAQEYGAPRVLEIFSRLCRGSAQNVVRELMENANQFRGQAPQADDITLFSLQYTG